MSADVTNSDADGTATVDFDNLEIDPQRPGFASLLPVLAGVLDGHVGVDVLRAYVTQLRPRVNAAYDQVQAMQDQPFQKMGLAEEHIEHLRSAFMATTAAVQELHQILLLCEGYLEDSNSDKLEEAEERLGQVQGELRQVI